jgi:hypothetical protein
LNKTLFAQINNRADRTRSALNTITNTLREAFADGAVTDEDLMIALDWIKHQVDQPY